MRTPHIGLPSSHFTTFGQLVQKAMKIARDNLFLSVEDARFSEDEEHRRMKETYPASPAWRSVFSNNGPLSVRGIARTSILSSIVEEAALVGAR